MPFQPGEILAGKYKVIDLIGTGGIAFVISARHVRLDEVVALKFLRPELATYEDAVRRFTIEARVNFKLKSPHVVRVLDVETLADGTPFMIMELLEGIDLGRLLEKRGALSMELAVEYTLQACEGLASAHAAYVVHRDIKPANLFLSKTAQGAEQIKLLDFGISKIPRAEKAPTTTPNAAGAILGSPPYMSPEQIRGLSETDARTDIWSMGCVLYELLTGTAPFERDDLNAICAAILNETPQPLSERCPKVPAALEAIVMRCLSKDPDGRFQHVAELSSALAAVRQSTFKHDRRAATDARNSLPPERESADRMVSIDSIADIADIADDAELRSLRRARRSTEMNRLLIASIVAVLLIAAYAGTHLSTGAKRAPAAPDSVSTTAAPIASSAPSAKPNATITVPNTPPLNLVEPTVAQPIEPPSAADPKLKAAVRAPVKTLKLRAKARPAEPAATDPDVGF